MKDLPHIGTIELVSLPDDKVKAVPAKIDTGADNSSIWASNIQMKDGKLAFNFFAPGNVFYKEKPVISSAFRTTTVRNSFGQKEFRYKIRLKVTIGEHTISRWFTLADRSRNNYPILLGKNFLKNRFIVDVSRKYLVSRSTKGPGKVLILTGYPDETTNYFKEAAKASKKPIVYECVGYEPLQYFINTPTIRVINTHSDEDLANYSFTYFKNHHSREFASSAAEYLHYKGRPFANKEFNQFMSASKLSEYMRLGCYGIPVPPTVCAINKILKAQYKGLIDVLGSPFVLKEMHSDKGKFNYLINNKKDFNNILAKAPDTHIYLAQKYIPNDGYYRMYVMGKEVKLAIFRSQAAHKDRLKAHLNKPRGSANAKIVPLNEASGQAQELAVRAADCMDRQIAGVDLVQDNTTNKWYVLETNNDPQIRTGSFIDAKMAMVAKYFEEELNH